MGVVDKRVISYESNAPRSIFLEKPDGEQGKRGEVRPIGERFAIGGGKQQSWHYIQRKIIKNNGRGKRSSPKKAQMRTSHFMSEGTNGRLRKQKRRTP